MIYRIAYAIGRAVKAGRLGYRDGFDAQRVRSEVSPVASFCQGALFVSALMGALFLLAKLV